jgi:cysteinyl-tRNA synthetase
MLKIYNTLTREVGTFKPPENRKTRMFTCGPSIYAQQHIGNYRTFLFEDVLQRYIEYLGYTVIRLLAITDVEDKAIIQANSKKTLTEKNLNIFLEDSKFLKIKPPAYMPRSSTIIDQSVKLIQLLLKKGFAYRHEKNVYFDPLKFENFGKLANLDMNKWPKIKRRFHKDTYPGIRWNRGDFILWHGKKENDKFFWKTEIGNGRPAWNIQDASMITKHLGYSVDIACGGIDNLARHHDYTIAIIESISNERYADYWLHGGHLFVEGKKMAKSKGNIIYLNDLIKMGFKKEEIRLFLIYHHYRKRLHFNLETLKELSVKIERLRGIIKNLGSVNSPSSDKSTTKLIDNILKNFEKNMNEDLNVKQAFDDISISILKLNYLNSEGKLSSMDAIKALNNLRKIDDVLQILF